MNVSLKRQLMEELADGQMENEEVVIVNCERAPV